MHHPSEPNRAHNWKDHKTAEDKGIHLPKMSTREEVPTCQMRLLLWDWSSHVLCLLVLMGCLPSACSISSHTTPFYRWPHLSPLLTLGETHLLIPWAAGTCFSGSKLSLVLQAQILPWLSHLLFLPCFRSLYQALWATGAHFSMGTCTSSSMSLTAAAYCFHCTQRSLPIGKCGVQLDFQN